MVVTGFRYFSPTLFLTVAKMNLPKRPASYWSSIFWHSGTQALSRERPNVKKLKTVG